MTGLSPRIFRGLTLKPPLSAAEITVRDLLTHTHGISNAGPITLRTAHTGDHSPALLLRLLSEYDPASRGRAFAYGNPGYNVAGMALEARLGKSWQEIVSDLVLRPLDMKDTSAYISRADRARLALPHAAAGAGYRQLRSKADSTMHAAGGHVTTARDLTRWIEAHLNRGRVDGRQVFPAAVEQTRDLAERIARRQSLPHPLGTYAGSYYNEAAGCLEVQVARDRLRATMGVAEGDIDVTDGPMNRVEVDLTGGPMVMTFAMEDGQGRALTFEGHQFSKRSCP